MYSLRQDRSMEIVNDSVFQKELQDLKTPFKLKSGNIIIYMKINQKNCFIN